MKDIAVGGDSFIWNGETTIHSDSKVVALDTSGFAEGNEKLKKIQYFNVSDMGMGASIAEQRRKMYHSC